MRGFFAGILPFFTQGMGPLSLKSKKYSIPASLPGTGAVPHATRNEVVLNPEDTMKFFRLPLKLEMNCGASMVKLQEKTKYPSRFG